MARFNRKGQEEITGFVVVVVLVVVVLLVLLGISIRSDAGQGSDSVELRHFLESVVQTSSECAVNLPDERSSVSDLAISCARDSHNTCSSGENVCDEAEKAFEELINAGWLIGENESIKGYELDVDKLAGSNSSETLVDLTEGSCLNDFIADEYALPERRSGGKIIVNLKLCF